MERMKREELTGYVLLRISRLAFSFFSSSKLARVLSGCFHNSSSRYFFNSSSSLLCSCVRTGISSLAYPYKYRRTRVDNNRDIILIDHDRIIYLFSSYSSGTYPFADEECLVGLVVGGYFNYYYCAFSFHSFLILSTKQIFCCVDKMMRSFGG